MIMVMDDTLFLLTAVASGFCRRLDDANPYGVLCFFKGCNSLFGGPFPAFFVNERTNHKLPNLNIAGKGEQVN